MSAVWTVVAVSTAVSAYSANQSAKANNRASDRASANARKRYALNASVAGSQMDEEHQNEMALMTDVTKQFLVAKGRQETATIESGTSGVSAQRADAVLRLKASEKKGEIARETNINVINIAQDMLAKKIDTDAMLMEASAMKKNIFTETLLGGIQGATSGYSMGQGMKQGGSSGKSTQSVSESRYTNNNFTQTNNTRGL